MTSSDKPTNEIGEALKKLLDGNDDVFPTHLVANFPHIVEKLCLLWKEPLKTNDFFSSLLTTDRENRIGFSPEIHREIFLLSDYYYKLYPTAKKIDIFWSGVGGF